MKKDWNKLTKEYKDSPTALVADVDCTAAGKDLCETHGVQGFPTLKYGDPADLQDYEGERDLKSLRKFAKKNLSPQCSPNNINMCSDEKKAQIEELQKLGAAELDKRIAEKKAEKKAVDKWFEEEEQKLQKRYEEMEKEKAAKIAAIKESGLGLMKAVRSTLTEDKDEL